MCCDGSDTSAVSSTFRSCFLLAHDVNERILAACAPMYKSAASAEAQ